MKQLLLIFIVALIVNSCGDTNNITSPDESHIVQGSIKGTILDKITNEPVVGAFVTTLPLTSTTKSNEDGTFLLASVGPEVYNIIISHPDYQTYNEKIRVSDQITNDIEFSLISFESLNHAPEIPLIVYPQTDSKVGGNTISFRWTGADRDADSLKFDIYFGKENTELTKIAENITKNSFSYTHQFNENVNYEWYVVSKDKYSETASEKAVFTYKKIIITKIEGLIALWKLNSDALDYGPSGFNGIENNIQYVDDRKDEARNAAYFSGSNTGKTKITIPKDLQLSYQFTISMWIKPDPSLGENGTVGNYECISKWGGAGPGEASWAFGINKNSTIFLATYNSSSDVKSATTNKIEPNKWQHIAVTFYNGTAVFYLNGVYLAESSGMQIPQFSHLAASIGARQDFVSKFHGAIDDIYLFDRPLTDAEILQLSQE